MRPTVETRLGFEDQPSKNPDSRRIAKRYGIAGICQSVSRRDSRTQPGVLTPGTDPKNAPPQRGASKSSSCSCSKSGVGCSGVLEYCACCELHPADEGCSSDLGQDWNAPLDPKFEDEDSLPDVAPRFGLPPAQSRPRKRGTLHKKNVGGVGRTKRLAGLSLIELLVVLTIIALISALITTSVMSALQQQDKRVCQNNMLTIEAAKDEYIRDHPGATSIDVTAFPQYFRFGIPRCPDGGTYQNLYNLTQQVSCNIHGPIQTFASPTP
jgi:prepilin-type N-terminal cleavage/methylation domain-containing protein